jgi:hypothetical protein
MSSKPTPATFHPGAHDPTHLGAHPEDVTHAVVDVAPYQRPRDLTPDARVPSIGAARAFPLAAGKRYASTEGANAAA